MLIKIHIPMQTIVDGKRGQFYVHIMNVASRSEIDTRVTLDVLLQ